MKTVDSKLEATISYAALLEKIEILRSTLRWAQSLDRAQIQKLLNQCTRAARRSAAPVAHGALRQGQRHRRLVTRALRSGGMHCWSADFQFEGVFGDSPRLIEALEIAEKAARTDLPVLIDGESGTGKELMAKVIHANGSRADRPYITVNCGAIPENLLESELFGHKRGRVHGRDRTIAPASSRRERRHDLPGRDRRAAADRAR